MVFGITFRQWTDAIAWTALAGVVLVSWLVMSICLREHRKLREALDIIVGFIQDVNKETPQRPLRSGRYGPELDPESSAYSRFAGRWENFIKESREK
jgi:hypothetical protein